MSHAVACEVSLVPRDLQLGVLPAEGRDGEHCAVQGHRLEYYGQWVLQGGGIRSKQGPASEHLAAKLN